MNQEKPNLQKYENLNNNKKDEIGLSPEKLKNISPSELNLETNNKEKRIEEVRQNLDKIFGQEPFNESLILQKLKEASDIIYDMDAMPLSADSNYQMISEWLTTQCEKAVSVFFKKARDGNAEERLRYSAALMRLEMVADKKAFDDALKQNSTNRQTIEELYKKSREENKLSDERKLTAKEAFGHAGKILMDGIKYLFRRE